jgi:hypothetical protein
MLRLFTLCLWPAAIGKGLQQSPLHRATRGDRVEGDYWLKFQSLAHVAHASRLLVLVGNLRSRVCPSFDIWWLLLALHNCPSIAPLVCASVKCEKRLPIGDQGICLSSHWSPPIFEDRLAQICIHPQIRHDGRFTSCQRVLGSY